MKQGESQGLFARFDAYVVKHDMAIIVGSFVVLLASAVIASFLISSYEKAQWEADMAQRHDRNVVVVHIVP